MIRRDEVELRLLGQRLVFGDDVVQHLRVDLQFVAALLKRDAENVLVLDRRRLVIRVDLHDVVVALALRLEDRERFLRVARGDDAVRDLAGEQRRGLLVADVGERRPIAVGGHSVRAARSRVRRRDRRKLEVVDEVDLLQRVAHRLGHRGARRADMLEGGRRRQAGRRFQLLHELPGIQRVHEVDVARLAVQHLNRQVAAVVREDLRRLLVRVASVFEFEFFHNRNSPFPNNHWFLLTMRVSVRPVFRLMKRVNSETLLSR